MLSMIPPNMPEPMTCCMAWSTHNVFDEVGQAELAQGPQSKAPDGGVLVFAVLGEQVDGQQGQIRVVLRVGGDVQVQHLLQDDVLVAGDGAGHHLQCTTKVSAERPMVDIKISPPFRTGMSLHKHRMALT